MVECTRIQEGLECVSKMSSQVPTVDRHSNALRFQERCKKSLMILEAS